jgi:hypothetical protein
MRVRRICEVEEASGKKPVSLWLSAEMDKKELAKFHVRLTRIEADETLPEEWLKPYVSLKMTELKFDLRRRAFRILCKERGREVIMLAADAKKGRIDPTIEAQAEARWKEIEKERAHVRSYPLPGRPSDDVERLRR